MIYRTPFCVNVYGSYKLLKTVRFLAHPVQNLTKRVENQVGSIGLITNPGKNKDDASEKMT